MPRKNRTNNKTNFPREKAEKKQHQNIGKGLGESAEVIDIVLDPGHPLYNTEQFPDLRIGDILARPLLEFNIPTDTLQWYHPFLANFYAGYPLIGEVVLLVEAPGGANQVSLERTQKYYLPAVNAWQDPNHNQLPASSFNVNLLHTTPSEAEQCNPSGQMTAKTDEKEPVDLTPALGRTFQDMDVLKLQPYEGDVIFEGRYGQSMRFGSTFKTGKSPNYWSAGGENGDPIFIISNGHRPQKEMLYHIEDPNQDSSIMYMCGGNSVKIDTASDNWDSYDTSFDAETLKEIPEALFAQTPAPGPYDPKEEPPERPDPVEKTPEEVVEKQQVNSLNTSEEKKQGLDECEDPGDCPDGTGWSGKPDCECVDQEEKPPPPPPTKNEHTCGLDIAWNKEVAGELAPAALGKDWNDLDWISKSKRYIKGPHSSGGECFVGILHWTGRSMNTLYKAMNNYYPPGIRATQKNMIQFVWPRMVDIPAYDSEAGKGLYYNGKYAGKRVKITLDVLEEFSKNADTKELNYSWWADPMKDFLRTEYSKPCQIDAVWMKFKDDVTTGIANGGWKTAREYAFAMCGLNSAPAYFEKHAGSVNWNAEKLGQIYCSGDWGRVSACRSRCNNINRYFPACEDQYDENSVYYTGYIYGGCTGRKVKGGEKEHKKGKYIVRSTGPSQEETVYKDVRPNKYGRPRGA